MKYLTEQEKMLAEEKLAIENKIEKFRLELKNKRIKENMFLDTVYVQELEDSFTKLFPI